MEISTACGLATWALVSTRPSFDRMTPEPTPATNRRAPSSNVTSRTSMRTTASSSRLKSPLIAARAEAAASSESDQQDRRPPG